jgi:GTP-binding protein
MKKISFKNTVFVKTAVLEKDYPHFRMSTGACLPEIAVLGRSNVGKSSLLNFLFQSKNLVKTAKTPGKTRALNFFNVDQKLIFVDLPGYGYAKAPLEYKKMWAETLEGYVKTREALKLFLLLLDIRHMPSVEDCQMYRYLTVTKVPFIIVFTKIDKISPVEAEMQTEKIFNFLGGIDVACLHTSATKELGRDELIRVIMEVVA